MARRAVKLGGPRLTYRVIPAAWSCASGKPRAVTSASSGARRAWVWCHRRRCNAGSPGSSASARTNRQGLASRWEPTAPMRAAIPSGMAGNALPAWAQECLVGHPGRRGRQKPGRSQATGQEPPCRWACQWASSCTTCGQAARSGAVLQRPYARAAQARRTAAAQSPKSARAGMSAPRLWSKRPLSRVHNRWKSPRWVPTGPCETTRDKTSLIR